MNAKWALVLCGLALPCAVWAGQNPATPSSPTPRLTVVDGRNAPADVYDFGTARFGQAVTHRFTLRNDGAVPVALSRVELSCLCLSTPLALPSGKPLPTLAPGATLNIEVTLDTSLLSEAVRAPLLAGGQVAKQVRIYAISQPVHAAAVLEMRGRIVSGVSIQPALLNFGLVPEARGASQVVRIAVDAALYREGHTRLAAPKGSPLRIIPLPADAEQTEAAPQPAHTQPRPDIVRAYRVVLPPHTPIGALNGQLQVVGLAARTLPLHNRDKTIAAPALSLTLPYVAQVQGSVSAQPALVAFGLVAPSRRAPADHNPAPADRTRWILLRRNTPSAAPAASPSAAFWNNAGVSVDNPRFQAALVAPAPSSDSLAPRMAQTASPPPLAPGLNSETVCWLRVTLLPTAPRRKSLSAQAIVTLPDGERLNVPILAQTQ